MSYRDKFKLLFESSSRESIHQAIELLLMLEGDEEVARDVEPFLQGRSGLEPSEDLAEALEIDGVVDKDLNEAVMYALLKATNNWDDEQRLRLRTINPELQRIGMYQDLQSVVRIEACQGVLQIASELNSLQEVDVRLDVQGFYN